MTRESLDNLATRAKSGDRSALDDLARGIEHWAHRQSARLAKKFHPVERCDLFSEAMLTLIPSLRCWKPSLGGFLNYFASAASRAMCRHAQEAQDQDGPRFHNDELTNCPTVHQSPPDGPSDLLDTLTDGFTPIMREVFYRRHGLQGHAPRRRTSNRSAAKVLGVSEKTLRKQRDRAQIKAIAAALRLPTPDVRAYIAATDTFARWAARGLLCG